MDITQRVKRELDYQLAVSQDIDSEFKAAVKRSERWQGFEQYVGEQWKVFCNNKLTKGLGVPDDKKFKWFVKEALELYYGGLKAVATRMHESDLQARKRKELEDQASDAEQTLNGNPTGQYDDFQITEVYDGQEGYQEKGQEGTR